MANNNAFAQDELLLDVSKYGFDELPTSENGIMFFEKKIKDFTVELMVAENIYTLDYILHDERVNVANRYKVDTQEQLDFLLLNGRVGWLFK